MTKFVKHPYKWLSNLLLAGGISGLLLSFLFSGFIRHYGWEESLSYKMLSYYLFNSLLVLVSAILLKRRNPLGILALLIVVISVLMSLLLPSPDDRSSYFFNQSLFFWTTYMGYAESLFFLDFSELFGLKYGEIVTGLLGSPLFLGSILINLLALPYWLRIIRVDGGRHLK